MGEQLNRAFTFDVCFLNTSSLKTIGYGSYLKFAANGSLGTVSIFFWNRLDEIIITDLQRKSRIGTQNATRSLTRFLKYFTFCCIKLTEYCCGAWDLSDKTCRNKSSYSWLGFSFFDFWLVAVKKELYVFKIEIGSQIYSTLTHFRWTQLRMQSTTEFPNTNIQQITLVHMSFFMTGCCDWLWQNAEPSAHTWNVPIFQRLGLNRKSSADWDWLRMGWKSNRNRGNAPQNILRDFLAKTKQFR